MQDADITFIALYQEHHPPLLRFLECLLGRPELAQEIAQETFLRLYQREWMAPPDEARFWIFRVGRNLALNEINRGKTRSRLRRTVLRLLSPEPDRLPDEMLQQKEQIRSLSQKLDAMPEGLRSALLLREQEEMSYAEIASVLGMSLSQVKVNIFRAREHLRRTLRSDEPPEAKHENEQ